jgi:adenylosuccinate lyase
MTFQESMPDELLSVSPLDGRYAEETEPLRDYFSEFAFIRDRVRVEISYLISLSERAHLFRPLTSPELDFLGSLNDAFSIDEAHESKDYERVTRHDVKAVESLLRTKLAPTSLSDFVEFLHFGLTSEDVNSLAQALELRNSRDDVILPALDKIIEQIGGLVYAHKATPMLARTHGQPAVPTTLGKEMAVFYARLKKKRAALAGHIFEGKLSGAVGNFNALVTAAPKIDWLAFSDSFIRDLGLEPNLVTTQILPYDNWVEYFNGLHLINSVLLDLVQDLWHYISRSYFKLKVVANEVGSSAMPQKVNPIDLENAEGNLGLANALFEHYARKLPISRLQRDLSDSTVRRTFGSALGHTLVGYLSLASGLGRLEADESVLRSDLEAHWEVVSEGAQTILRAAGVNEAYDQLKSVVRGKGFSQESFYKWVENLGVDNSVKESLRGLSPLTYTGLAAQIADRALKGK